MSSFLNFLAHFPVLELPCGNDVLYFRKSCRKRHLLTERDTSNSQKCRQESGASIIKGGPPSAKIRGAGMGVQHLA